MMRAIGLFFALFVLISCAGSTGGEVVDFTAAAAGPESAVAGQPFAFDTYEGWHVVLTKASLYVGALYLDQSMPVSGAGNTSCVLPDTYVAQETSGMTVDLLSPVPTPFPAPARGITGIGRVAQIWLTGGDVNATDDDTTILAIEGTAEKAGDSRPFRGTITIGAGRVAGGAFAGAYPPCKQRIVPVPTQVQVQAHGGLLLRIDPRQLFAAVDFGTLQKPDKSDVYLFQNTDSDPASANLYSNLHSAGSLYTLRWVASF